jgi:hypothetical protein
MFEYKETKPIMSEFEVAQIAVQMWISMLDRGTKCYTYLHFVEVVKEAHGLIDEEEKAE